MKKLSILILLPLIIPSYELKSETPTGLREWNYFNCTILTSKNFAYVIMPGFRYEFGRFNDSGIEEKGLYFLELLTGPVFIKKTGNFTFKLPVWYYYMGFPVNTTGDYYYSHNIEFLPIVEYRGIKNLTLTGRIIFHNTLYSSLYETAEERSGYSLVLRTLIKGTLSINNKFNLVLGEEPFFGIVEDDETTPSAAGFFPSGFRLNRVYAGIDYKLKPDLKISPMYILETSHDEGGITGFNHYLHLNVSYLLKIF